MTNIICRGTPRVCPVVSFTADVATMTIIDVDKPEDRIVITSPMGSAALKGCHDVQNIGAVETYQRRYLWVAALEIVEHDAIDSADRIQSPNIDAAIEGINGSPDLAALRANFTAAIKLFDKSYHGQLTNAKDVRKEQITEELGKEME